MNGTYCRYSTVYIVFELIEFEDLVFLSETCLALINIIGYHWRKIVLFAIKHQFGSFVFMQIWEFQNSKVAVEGYYMIAVAATTNVTNNRILKNAEFCQISVKIEPQATILGRR